MKYIVHVSFGSIILAMGISYFAFKYAHKNIPPSIVGMLLLLIYVGFASFLDKKRQ